MVDNPLAGGQVRPVAHLRRHRPAGAGSRVGFFFAVFQRNDFRRLTEQVLELGPIGRLGEIAAILVGVKGKRGHKLAVRSPQDIAGDNPIGPPRNDEKTVRRSGVCPPSLKTAWRWSISRATASSSACDPPRFRWPVTPIRRW